VTGHERVSRYLMALAKVCAEVAAEPRLLPTFLRLIAMVPSTVETLERETRRRLAA
jgi:hypothetical protein